MLSLLFHFLDEWLYKFSANEFFIPRVSVCCTVPQTARASVVHYVTELSAPPPHLSTLNSDLVSRSCKE